DRAGQVGSMDGAESRDDAFGRDGTGGRPFSGLDGDGNQLPPAGETACPTYFAKRLIQQGGAGGFACRSNGHNQRSASKMNKFPKTVRRPWRASCFSCPHSETGLA